jgi:hypothetical protein
MPFRRDRSSRREGQRGQGLVEFSLVVPIIILVVVSVAELGLAFGNTQTVGYGSREGARVGSALATGGVTDCSTGDDPSLVDATLVSAIQRILKSPGSGIDIGKVQEIRIFKANASGDETGGLVNVWQYTGERSGPEVDPGPGVENIDFSLIGTNAWPACGRDNSASTPDSIGVTVVYRYDFVTPLPSVVNAIAGGNLSLQLSETTVMSLNPSI